MEKTYYRKPITYNVGGVWKAELEFADEPDGFFMKVVFEGDSESEVTQKMRDFLGQEAERVKSKFERA